MSHIRDNWLFALLAISGFFFGVGAGEGFAQIEWNHPDGYPVTSLGQTAQGDLNEDGFDDIVLLGGPILIEILLGNGQTGFKPGVDILVESGVYLGDRVVLADFNASGHLDILHTNLFLRVARFYAGNGDGTFGNPQEVSTECACYSAVVVADFDGDHNLDWATIFSNSPDPDQIAIYLGDGAGGFSTPTLITASLAPKGIAVGDFNEDTRADLVTVDVSTNQVYLYLGDGTGDFPTVLQSPLPTGARELNVGDFNGDGHLDLIAVSTTQKDAYIKLGDGQGGFDPLTRRLITGSGPHRSAVGDFNGDGVDDVAVSASSEEVVSILLSDEGDSFQRRFIGVPGELEALYCSDPDQDGNLDLRALVANETGDRVATLFGDGTGHFSGYHVFGGTGSSEEDRKSLLVADFDQDGHTDVSYHPGRPGALSLDLGDGNGNFSSLATNFLDAVGAVVGDFNGDDVPDIAGFAPGQNFVRVALGDGDGFFNDRFESPVGSPIHLLPVDLDEDGFDDLCAQREDGSFAVLRSNGDGTFVFSQVVSGLDFDPKPALAGDLNRDGHLDIVVRRLTEGPGSEEHVSILLGDGNGNLTLRVHLGFGGAVALDDVDRDGNVDLFVSNDTDLNILYGDGTGDFVFGQRFNFRNVDEIHVVDLNGDKRNDVVGASESGLYFVLGRRGGSFGPRLETQHLPLAQNWVAAPADFDEDGQIDFFFGSSLPFLWTTLNRTLFFNGKKGNVNGGYADPVNVLFANGSPGIGRQRHLRVSPNESFEIRMDAPPGAGIDVPFVLYAYKRDPNPRNVSELSFGVGNACLPMPLSTVQSPPNPRAIWKNIPGSSLLLGQPTFPSTPAPSVVVSLNQLGVSGTFFFQGLILDAFSPQGQLAVTNGLTVFSFDPVR